MNELFIIILKKQYYQNLSKNLSNLLKNSLIYLVYIIYI